jgi:hypothetical protein
MINIVTEGAVDPKFLTADDVQQMRYDIPVKDAKVDELMAQLANKMGIDEKVPWENVDDVVQADAIAGVPGIANVESFADSRSQQGVPSIWIIKKLLAQTKANPAWKINNKPLTADITFTPTDFNIYDAATITAKFATPVNPEVQIKVGARTSIGSISSEFPRDGHVLVDVYYADGQGWKGFYRPLIAVLQDGTEKVIPFS